jgi:hypothetical protein
MPMQVQQGQRDYAFPRFPLFIPAQAGTQGLHALDPRFYRDGIKGRGATGVDRDDTVMNVSVP